MDTKAAPLSKPSRITCPACNATKPRSQFKRLASLAQTRTWLNNPNATKRLTYVGKLCNSCRPKRATKDIPPSELEKMLRRNAVNPILAQEKLTARKALGAANRVKGALKGLRRRRSEGYGGFNLELTSLTRTLRSKLNYQKTEAKNPDPALVNYLELAAGVVKLAKQALAREYKAGRSAPVYWQSVIKPNDVSDLMRLFIRLNQIDSSKMRTTHNTLTAEVTNEKQSDRDSGAKDSIPAKAATRSGRTETRPLPDWLEKILTK